MSIIVNSRSIFCLSWKNAPWRIGNSKQNKEIDKEIDNNYKCQQVYKFLFYFHNTKSAHTSNSELFAILLRIFVHHNTTNRPCGGGWI